MTTLASLMSASKDIIQHVQHRIVTRITYCIVRYKALYYITRASYSWFAYWQSNPYKSGYKLYSSYSVHRRRMQPPHFPQFSRILNAAYVDRHIFVQGGNGELILWEFYKFM